jgi:hypothetical protein
LANSIDARVRVLKVHQPYHESDHVLHAPLNTLNAKWAYMIMVALAWTLKAWAALMVPVRHRWAARHEDQRETLLRMEFQTFLAALIHVPAQIVRRGAGSCTAYWRGTRRSLSSSACSTRSDGADLAAQPFSSTVLATGGGHFKPRTGNEQHQT